MKTCKIVKKAISVMLVSAVFLSSGISVYAHGPGGAPGGFSSSVSWSGATTYTSYGSYSDKSYSSITADENALLINTSGKVTLTNPTVTKSGGTSASDNYSFYGINSAVMCKGGGSTTINGGSITTTAEGANGLFSYGANNGTTNATGDGTSVTVSNMTINTTGNGSGGIMTTYGGTTIAKNLSVTTSGRSSAPIRTDRGGGWVTVTGGTYTSSGMGSPAIYSTADVQVTGAKLISEASEGVCIEGTGSIKLTNCNLTATNNTLNGNATFYDTVMIYQSMSGDASNGSSSFTMSGGSLTSNSGHTFHVTNTTATISLSNVAITNSSDNVLISVCDDGWSGGSNTATLNASGQKLEGDVLVGSDSSLTFSLSGSSTFTGRTSGAIKNQKNSTVSTSIGTVNMTVGSGCTWTLTGDSYVTSLTNKGTINTGDYTLYVNGKAYEAGTSDDTDDSDSSGTTDSSSSSTSADTTSTTNSGNTLKKGSTVSITNSRGNKIKYEVTSVAKKTVSFRLTKANAKTLTIPATVSLKGTKYKVTAVASKGAIAGKSKLTTVIIGKNVEKIGAKAFFDCSRLKSITFNSGNVTAINTYAYKNINKKATFTIKSGSKRFKAVKALIKKAGAPATATYKKG